MHILAVLRRFGLDFKNNKPNFYNGFFLGGTEVTSTAEELNKLDGLTATVSELNVLDGVTSTTAELNILDGVTAVAADLNKVAGMAAKGASIHKVAVVSLADADTAAGVLNWTNAEAASILVTGVIVNVTTTATGACTLDIGYANSGISADTIMDGLDVGTAIGTFNSIDHKGTNGLGTHGYVMGATERITASKASGSAAGLVGKAYIFYTTL